MSRPTRRLLSRDEKKARQYSNELRVIYRWVATEGGQRLPSIVEAVVEPASDDITGVSQEETVTFKNGVWTCTAENLYTPCAHRLVVQKHTGYGHLEGHSTADYQRRAQAS